MGFPRFHVSINLFELGSDKDFLNIYSKIFINKIKTTFGSPTNQTSTQQVRSIAEYSYYS